MFKVDASLKASKATRVLRKSDRRKLIDTILSSFRINDNNEIVDNSIADADVELRPAADCTLIAAVKGDAFFVELSPNKYLPTLITALSINSLPATMPVFETHAAVFVQHLSQGADFMLPGCRDADRMASIEPCWNVGDLVAVAVHGTPVALGTALQSRAQAAAADRKGKLVRVLHFYGDALWLASSRRGNDRVLAALTGATIGAEPPAAPAAVADSAAESSTSGVDVAATTSVGDLVPTVSPDDLVKQAFLRGASVVRDDELPMLVSTFYDRMLANRPPGTTVDLKASTFKKPLRFLQAMAETGAVKLDEHMPGVYRVTWIDRDSDVYHEAAASVASSAAAAAGGASASPVSLFASGGVLDVVFGRERVSVALPTVLAELASAKHPRLVELLSVDPSIAELFGDDQLLDVARAPKIVGNVMRQNTTSIGKNTCTLNAPLSAIFVDVAAGATLTKKAVTERISGLLQPCWLVLQRDGTPSRVHKGAPPHITVDECLVRGHKCTAVLGLQALLGVSLAAVCDDWRQQLATGCAEGEHHSQQAVIVQGLLSAAITTILERDFRLPSTVLTVRKLKGKR